MATIKIYDLIDYGSRFDRDSSFYAKYQNGLKAGSGVYGDGISGYVYRTLLKFDLSAIPQNVIITNAKLNLKIKRASYSGMIASEYSNLEARVITQNWDYVNLEFGYPSYKSDYESIIGKTIVGDWSVLDVTNSLAGIYSNSLPNYGWILKHQLEGSVKYDANREFYTPIDEDVNNRPYLEVTYDIPPLLAPEPLEPIGIYRDKQSIIHFSWKTNRIQTKFDLLWSADGFTWTTISETTANTFYDAPVDTFIDGNIYWKVRVYIESGEVSEYSNVVAFYAVGGPSTPEVQVSTNSSRPIVTWSVPNQQFYNIQILKSDTVLFDSGLMPGIDSRSYKIPLFLPNGTYQAKVKVINEFNLSSQWGTYNFVLNLVQPEKPTLALQRSAYGIQLNASNISNYALIYRSDYDNDNYIYIGKSSGIFYDNSVRNKAEYKYFVRAVSNEETFKDSDIKFIQADFKYAIIAPVSDLSNVFVFNRSLNTPPKRVYDRNNGGTSVLYAGRTYPVWKPDEHISAGMSFTFYLKTWAKVKEFIELYDHKETVLYRDSRRRKIYGTLGNLSVTDERSGFLINFTISQVDYDEELEV